jgi:hypothetical protein
VCPFAHVSVAVRQHQPEYRAGHDIRDCRQKVVMGPPSMVKSAPVTLPARSLASRRTRSAIYAGWVKRPVTESAVACLATASGFCPLVRPMVAATPFVPSHWSVATGPGLIVFTRIPCGPTSLHSDLAKLVSAALAAL